jgi:hypothetical protein
MRSFNLCNPILACIWLERSLVRVCLVVIGCGSSRIHMMCCSCCVCSSSEHRDQESFFKVLQDAERVTLNLTAAANICPRAHCVFQLLVKWLWSQRARSELRNACAPVRADFRRRRSTKAIFDTFSSLATIFWKGSAYLVWGNLKLGIILGRLLN